MKLQFFSINALQPELDQEKINDFCSRHRVVSIDKELITRNNQCFWAICITHLDANTTSTMPSPSPQKKRSAIDYREVLGEADFAIYAELRGLRKTLAEREGVPVYAIFSNAQLAELVTNKVLSTTAMKTINGIGSAKLQRYGQVFLEALNKSF